ncbi:MAG: DUF86 domain-containing protein [bacterium]
MKPHRDLLVYIEDIIDCINRIKEYTHALTIEAFLDNQQVQDAVIRRLEIIGEAVKNVPEEVRIKYPDIPWKEISGLRDILIHEYSGVNIERTWKVVQEDIPDLEKKIQQVHNELRH